MTSRLYYEAKWFTIILFFVAGIFFGALGLFTFVFNGGQFYGIQKLHPPKDDQHPFINPLLAVDVSEKIPLYRSSPLQASLSQLVTPKKGNGITQGSLYFRDIEAGTWIGINEDGKFSPGTLLKVPLMVAFLKQAESSPEKLKKTFVYKGQAAPQIIPPTYLMPKVGSGYSLEDLLNEMLINDDDNTAAFLFDNIDSAYLNEVFSDLGVNFVEDKATQDFITVKQNDIFFRVLYNATYLNRDMSNKALEILSKTSKTEGFSTGMINKLTIAHRYRIRNLSDGQLESHDCGIIYYPDHPYELCMMLIGKNSDVIGNTYFKVGQEIFSYLENMYGYYQKGGE